MLQTKHLQIRARNIVKELIPFISKEEKILDIGCGSGWISYYLKKEGFNIVLCDTTCCIGYDDTVVHIINNDQIPFKKNEFDVALLVSVLHHAQNPQKVISEAKRVAKRVIVLEL